MPRAKKRPPRVSDVPVSARRLLDLPNVGPASALDLVKLGISDPQALAGGDPDRMYDALCKIDGVRHDPCVRDVFAAVVAYANGAPARPWWAYTPERRGRMRRTIGAFLIASAATLVRAATDPAADPSGWLASLDAAKPAADGWDVENVRVELGPARLDIERGTLVAVRGPAAHAQEFLFVGKARFGLATDDPVESYQIELFTGRDRLDEPVTRAVLAIAADDIADALAARPGAKPLTPDQARGATDMLAAWRASPEYRRSGVRFQALADAIGDQPAQRFAAAWCEAPRLGRFLVHVDPYAAEQVVVEQFVPLRLGDVEKDSWRRWLRGEQAEGRRLEQDPDDVGDWNVWHAEALRNVASQKIPGVQAFEPSHYELETKIDDQLESIEGRAVIDISATLAGVRLVRLSLYPDLAVDAIAVKGGPALPWVRSRDQIVTVLPEVSVAGAKTSLNVRYHGVLFERDYDKLLVKRTTTSWYPHVGSVDLASYRASFDVPGSVTLLGSGRLTSSSKDGDRRHQVRELDAPTRAFGFEIGKYKVVTRTFGHVAMELGFLSDLRTASESERELVIATLGDALAAYEQRFGPYPLDYLSVATTRHAFAQGLLGFISLSDDIVQNIDTGDAEALDKRRIIAHELAHQWWGHLVTWASERDMWLSESLANYAAALFRRNVLSGGKAGADAYLDLVATEEYLPDTIVGRPVEAMGPITLGTRLQSSLSDEAYHAIIYQKGAKVLAMLAEQLTEEPFVAMLKELAQRARFRPLDTETVLAALEKMSGRSLQPFATAFVRGVGYPQIHYEYRFEPVDGGFAVRGTMRQVPRGFRRDRLVRSTGGGFDVASSFHVYQSEQSAQAVVSGVVSVVEDVGESPRAEQRIGGRHLNSTALRGFKVTMMVSGPSTPFAFKITEKPKALHLDPRTMLPTTAVNMTLEPRRSLAVEAAALHSAGRFEEARAALTKALGLKLDVNPDSAPLSNGEIEERTNEADGRLRLAIAELAFDEGRFEDGAAELEQRTVGMAAGMSRYVAFRRKLLRARLALHSGDAASAYKLCSGALSLDVLQKETDTAFDAMRKNNMRSGADGRAGDYLIYAAAAHATGHEDVCREAADEARRRGGDASLLDELHGAGSSP